MVDELETRLVFEGFEYCGYLARQGVYAMIRHPQVEFLETGQGSTFWAALYTFKARTQIQPKPYAALLTGILLGVETGIPHGWYSLQNAIPVCA